MRGNWRGRRNAQHRRPGRRGQRCTLLGLRGRGRSRPLGLSRQRRIRLLGLRWRRRNRLLGLRRRNHLGPGRLRPACGPGSRRLRRGRGRDMKTCTRALKYRDNAVGCSARVLSRLRNLGRSKEQDAEYEANPEGKTVEDQSGPSHRDPSRSRWRRKNHPGDSTQVILSFLARHLPR